MDTPTVEILIGTRSVVLQQGLGALLECLPCVKNVKAIGSLQSASAWIEERQPKIILLDESLVRKNPKPALEKIRSLSTQAQRVLLADDVQSVNLLLTHAEAVLIKGIQPSAIASTITNLMSTKGDEHEHNDSVTESKTSPFREVLGNRNFRLLWIGEGVSVLGDHFYMIALTCLVLQLTGDSLAMGTVLALSAKPAAR